VGGTLESDVKMATPSQFHSYSEDFAFQFDAPFPSIAYDKYLSWSGWLVHRHGKPIHGLRAVVRRTLLGRKIIRARRKRERPDVATAFPNLTEAKTSGFLFELQLGLGTNYLTFQVQDQRHVWRTFCTTTIRAAPLNFLDLLGFRQSRSVLTRILQSWAYDRAQRVVHLSAPVGPLIAKTVDRSTGSFIKRIDLLATSKSNLFIREIGADEANKVLTSHRNDGFHSVFNGKNFDGWAGPVSEYEVKDSAICCQKGKGGTIYTKDEFADFVARVEFRLPPGGNNGLAIRYPGEGDTAYGGTRSRPPRQSEVSPGTRGGSNLARGH